MEPSPLFLGRVNKTLCSLYKEAAPIRVRPSDQTGFNGISAIKGFKGHTPNVFYLFILTPIRPKAMRDNNIIYH